MSQLKKVVEPFGEVNVYPAGAKNRVVATILMEPHQEGRRPASLSTVPAP